jgi:fructose-bisphosphate aldolase class II
MITAVTSRAHRRRCRSPSTGTTAAGYAEILPRSRSASPSVMIDGSMLPFADNVALSRKGWRHRALRRACRSRRSWGTIGATDGEAEEGAAAIIYTDPGRRRDVRPETGVDSLAIAIGTYHGIYPPHAEAGAQARPARRRSRRGCEIPLVPARRLEQPGRRDRAGGPKLGINKFNISSDIKVAYHAKMREVLADRRLREPLTIQPPCIEAMKVVAVTRSTSSDAAGRASAY